MCRIRTLVFGTKRKGSIPLFPIEKIKGLNSRYFLSVGFRTKSPNGREEQVEARLIVDQEVAGSIPVPSAYLGCIKLLKCSKGLHFATMTRTFQLFVEQKL